MVRAVTKATVKSLDLAVTINEEHSKFMAGLEHARNAGEYLIKAKGLVGYSNWLDWVEENLEFSDRTAEDYMRIAKHWETIQANSQGIANLTLTQALKLISTPRTKPKPPAPAAEQKIGADGQLDYEFEGDDIVVGEDEGGQIKMATAAPGSETEPNGKVVETFTKVVHYLERLADSANSLKSIGEQGELVLLVKDARTALDKIQEVLA